MLLVIFGSVFGNQDLGEGLDITFAQYFVAGMIASGVLYTSFQNLAIAIPMERDDGTLKRLQGTPMPKASYFLGKIGLVFVAYVAQVTLLIVVGVLFYKIAAADSTATQWFTFAWASVLGLVSCTLLRHRVLRRAQERQGRLGRRLPDRARAAVHLRRLLRLRPAPRSGCRPSRRSSRSSGSRRPCAACSSPTPRQALEVAGSWELARCAAVLAAWCVGGLVLSLLFFRWNKRGQG